MKAANNKVGKETKILLAVDMLSEYLLLNVRIYSYLT